MKSVTQVKVSLKVKFVAKLDWDFRGYLGHNGCQVALGKSSEARRKVFFVASTCRCVHISCITRCGTQVSGKKRRLAWRFKTEWANSEEMWGEREKQRRRQRTRYILDGSDACVNIAKRQAAHKTQCNATQRYRYRYRSSVWLRTRLTGNDGRRTGQVCFSRSRTEGGWSEANIQASVSKCGNLW